MERRKSSNLPPGFRFHPTDEELIIHYLKNQAQSRQCPVSIIPELDIYKFNPWELPEKTEFGETEWYFFSPRDRKYPNGDRPNRATDSGYWKATGTDKAIYSGSKIVGVKKALVFYKGRAPKGTKTDWIMHEYRLQESTSPRPMRLNGGSMKGEVYHSYMEVLLGDGIFNADGEMWRKQRKTASFEFASKNLRDFSTTVFREHAMKLSSILCQASIHNQELDMQDLLMRMTLDSICKVGFGVEIGTLSPRLPDNRFARAFDTANIIVTLRFIDPLWRIKRFFHVGSEALLNQSIKLVNDFTYSVIKKRKAEFKEARSTGKKDKIKQDILSRFIELSENPESNLSDKNLRDVVLNFVIAGRDTTATTLSWFIYMIMTHPHVADKLYSELKGFETDRAEEEKVILVPYDSEDPKSFNERISQFADLLTYDSLGRLSYLHAAITETLRLYPAVPQDPKGILEDDVLPDGTKVKAGGMVTYVPYSMGRMEYIWGLDAASFKPDRWFKGGVLQNVSPFKFTAFQAGPRICLGKDSAYLQMKMTLAILCRYFVFTLVPKHPVRYRMMTILSMAYGLKIHVSARS